MATQAILTFSDGKLAIPPEVQEQMHLTEGTQLRLILTEKDRIVLEPAESAVHPRSCRSGSGSRVTLAVCTGMLSDHPEHDTSKARAEERAWELEHDEREVRSLSPSNSPRLVLDAWPVMEWLEGPQACGGLLRSAACDARLSEARLFMSRINLGEIYYTTAKESGPSRAKLVLAALQELPIELVSITDEACCRLRT